MFSPSISQVPSGSVRNSRRRPRPLSNEGSINQPKAKRQRSALSEHTFLPPDGAPEMEETKAPKTAALPRRETSRELAGQRREIAVRGKKSKSGDRGTKGDGSVVLTTNDTYTVSKLPALPDRLRADVTGRQHGAIDSESGYALILTHSHAIVWPYAVPLPSPETFTFALPYPSKLTSDPLPLGSLVSASASSAEPGLVVIIPTTGKITYWESIASAATLDLIRQQRNGVELAISGMLSGEAVTQILNAESAGFILVFSSGRLAYMNVRDGQGRPSISVQFLRGSNGPVNSGIFGSLRNVLSSTVWRGDVVAVRAGRPAKVGERSVVVATAKGKIQSWNIHRGGHTSLQAEFEGRDDIVGAMKEAQSSLSEISPESFEIVDFTYAPKSLTNTQLSDQGGDATHLLLLVSLTDRHKSYYSLIEVGLKPDELSIGNIRPLKSYTTPVTRTATTKPRLYLPSPALVAYIVFDRAVVVISMAKQPDSPDSQLQLESHILQQTFEDVIDFRGDMNVEIVGSGMEEPHGTQHGIEDSKSRRYKAKYPSAVLLVRGGGVLRVAAIDVAKLISNKAQQITAKSKLEQAVFFGNLERNPVSFAVRPELQFSPEEVGVAAIELSLEILKSSTPHIPAVPASIDSNLRTRAASLQHLAEYLKDTGVALDRVTRWRLLWNAEKMEAASRIWKSYDASVKAKPEGQKRGLLTDIVESIHEDYKSNPVAEAGELDRVRHWFINDIWNLEVAVPWAYQTIKLTYQDGQKEHEYVMQVISEANDLVIDALDAAFKFRTANLELYGLQNEQLEHGILKDNYEGLPEFWTSIIFIVVNIRRQVDLAGALVKEYWQTSAKEPGKIDPALPTKLRDEMPILVDLAIRSNLERIRWDSAQSSPQLQLEAEQLRLSLSAAQDEHIIMLATDLALNDEAIAVAEKHQIMPTLATVVIAELNICAVRVRDPNLGREEFEYYGDRTISLEDRVRQYFKKFGEQWATALYEHDIELGEMAQLLDNYQDQKEFLTKFLCSKPEYAKIAWLHEVTRESNFEQAADTLLDLGLNREQDLWSKKIELSLGKLALLAGRNYSQTNGIIIPDGGETELSATRSQLALIKIQDQIYDHVFSSIEAAIDDKAEVQLALEAYGNKRLKKQQALSSFLEEKMGRLVRHESMSGLDLVDLLTLMCSDEISEEQQTFRAQQFYLALQASSHGIPDKDERSLVQRVIWRRCMLRDDWAVVNNTDMKDDQEVNEQLRKTTLYLTFKTCFHNRIFEKDLLVKSFSPQDVVGACTEQLDHRFDRLDASIKERIMMDMRIEDEALAPYLNTCRLDKWYQGALDLAKKDVEKDVDEETNDGKKMQDIAQKLHDMEMEIAKNEKSKAQALLKSKPRFKVRRGGSAGNLRRSIQ